MENRVEFEIGGCLEQQSPQQQHYNDGDIIPESEDYNNFLGNSRRHNLSLPDLKQAGTFMKIRRISSDLAVSISPEEAPSKKILKKKDAPSKKKLKQVLRVEFEIGGCLEQQSPQQQHYNDGDIIPESEDYNHFSGNIRRHSLSLPDLKQAGTFMKIRRIASDLAVFIFPEEAPSKKKLKKKDAPSKKKLEQVLRMESRVEFEIGGCLEQRQISSPKEVLSKKKLKKKDVSSTVEYLLTCFSDLDYLDRINGDQVIIKDTFQSKYVLVFAYKAPQGEYNIEEVFPKDPAGVCSELYRFRDDFEMVVALTGNDPNLGESGFNHLVVYFLPHFSLVVPYEHSKIRASLCDYLGVNAHGSSNWLLVNANQNILHYHSTAAEQYLQDLFPVRPIDFVTFFNRLIRSTWPVVSSEAKGPALSKRGCPVSNSMKYVLPEYPHDINKMVSESQKSCPIEIGRSLDVISLLSGGGVLSYLDRKDGDPVAVKEESFIGKYIMICCFYVPIFRNSSDAWIVQHIVNTCFDLYNTRNDFEMVVVVKMRYKADHEAVFDHFLSVFPSCLVVPYKESMHRDFICKYLDLVDKSSIQCLILDADDNRNILYHGTPAFLLSYGADAFPFTKEKIKEVIDKDKMSCSSLEGLLECDSSYVLENGNGETITISELNKKVVALYLCRNGDFTSTLHMVHQQCIENQLSFEIVVVYIPYDNCLDPRVHKGKIDRLLKKKRISWWCLPINNNVSLKFKRLVGCANDSKFVIVGPDNEYVDLHGQEILKRRGIDGYPFTREGLIEKELKRLHGLTLESLLVIGSKNYVYKGSTTYPLADLLGKNVLVYFAGRSIDLYHPLLTWYNEIKEDVDDLEVVIVRLEDELAAAAYDDLEVAEIVKPWYVCPYDPKHSKILQEKIFIGGVRESLVKFGSDGKICSFRAQYYLADDGPKAFREIGDPHLREDIIKVYLLGML